MKKLLWILPNRNNIMIWIFTIIMLLGVLVFGWQAETVLLSYFFETIIIGFIHIFKLWATHRYSKVANADGYKPTGSGFFGIILFIFNYFFFVFIQSVFVFSFFEPFIPEIKNAFNVLENYMLFLKNPDILIACFSMLLANLSLTLQNFFFPRKYESQTMEKLFLQPYLRIFIQQFVTILTGFVMMLLNAAMVSALILISIRFILDMALLKAANDPDFRKSMTHLLSGNAPEEKKLQLEKQIDSFLNH